MAHVPDRAEDAALADTRRRQILDAAADVFARRGFHAASMAEIARSFGMSAGHIYNWFDSKEAIIEALVQRDLVSFLEFVSEMRDAEDPRRALVLRADRSIDEKLDDKRGALQVEIMAEASRNPKIARILRESDAAVRRGLAGLLAGPMGLDAEAPELQARVEVLMSLFEGLSARGIRHPELDRAAYKQILAQQLAHILHVS